MAATDLALLADVKSWVKLTSTADDAIISRLITDVSGAIYAYLGRTTIIPRSISERYDGHGKRRLYLRQFPVISISSILVNDVAVPVAPAPASGASWPQAGYLLEPWDGMPPGRIQALDLYGDWALGQPYSSFTGGRQNVAITYTAGYQVTAEAATVPANPGPYTVTAQAPYGPWATNSSVTYANGTALTAVPGTPAAGQYSVAAGVYTFAAADAAASVLISYGYIPAVINNACIEWVAERYRYRERIGQTGQTVAGQQTAQYSLTGKRTLGMPDFIAMSLDPFRNVVPLA